MARKTVLICDSYGSEVEDGKGAVMVSRSMMRGVVRNRLIFATVALERRLVITSLVEAAGQWRSRRKRRPRGRRGFGLSRPSYVSGAYYAEASMRCLRAAIVRR